MRGKMKKRTLLSAEEHIDNLLAIKNLLEDSVAQLSNSWVNPATGSLLWVVQGQIDTTKETI